MNIHLSDRRKNEFGIKPGNYKNTQTMKLTRFFFFLTIYLSGGCTQNTKEVRENNLLSKDTAKVALVYPLVVDSLQLQFMYDNARWTLYTWNCDSPYRPKKDSANNEKRSFGMLPINFDTLLKKSDTIEFYFNYMDGREIVTPTTLKYYIPLKNGVGYNYATGEKLYLISRNNYIVKQKGIATRFEDPLQPEVVKYIDSNWSELAPEFKLLAEKKGLKPCVAK